MIDLGNIPRAVQAGVNEACCQAEEYVEGVAKTVWADLEREGNVENWERMFGIVNVGSISLEDRVKNVLARLNANGNAHVDWFIELARFLGYRHLSYSGGQQINGVRKDGNWIPKDGNWIPMTISDSAVNFCDGETPPFRAGVSLTGDRIYDDITFGATTCIVYYRQGNNPMDFGGQLKDLIRAARNVGTVLVFEKTD